MVTREGSSVLVALSGGVDSAFSAAVLKEGGWDVHGIHFILPARPDAMREKTDAALKIGVHLRIPVQVLDLREAFAHAIVEPFVSAYLNGRTPNPCVLCNPVIKFDSLLRHAEQAGIPFVATGHYARVERRKGSSLYDLKRGLDPGKEQSYFLHRLTQAHLSRAIFPLAGLSKGEVRNRSRNMAIPVHSAPESQEICFLPGKDYRVFLEGKGRGAQEEGRILDRDGRLLGKHPGAYRYTIGQRHGLGLASDRPFYVKEIRPERNEVIVGRKEELFGRVVEAEDFSWVEGAPAVDLEGVAAQVRYRHRAAPGRIQILAPRRVRFIFDEPQWAITPGQALACYTEDRLLGGGWILPGSE